MVILDPNGIDNIKNYGVDTKKKMLAVSTSYVEGNYSYDGYVLISNDVKPMPDDEFQELIAQLFIAFDKAGSYKEVSIGAYQEFLREKELVHFLSYTGTPTRSVLVAYEEPTPEEPSETSAE